jgi:hypothetical protein
MWSSPFSGKPVLHKWHSFTSFLSFQVVRRRPHSTQVVRNLRLQHPHLAQSQYLSSTGGIAFRFGLHNAFHLSTSFSSSEAFSFAASLSLVKVATKSVAYLQFLSQFAACSLWNSTSDFNLSILRRRAAIFECAISNSEPKLRLVCSGFGVGIISIRLLISSFLFEGHSLTPAQTLQMPFTPGAPHELHPQVLGSPQFLNTYSIEAPSFLHLALRFSNASPPSFRTSSNIRSSASVSLCRCAVFICSIGFLNLTFIPFLSFKNH